MVIPSFIPIVFIVGYDLILGCTIVNIINKHLVDFILIVFAISVSVFSSAMLLIKNTGLGIDGERSDNYVLFAVLVAMWCVEFFTFLYDKLKPNDNLSCKKLLFCAVQIVITILIIRVGMKVEDKAEVLSKISSSEIKNNLQSQEGTSSDV